MSLLHSHPAPVPRATYIDSLTDEEEEFEDVDDDNLDDDETYQPGIDVCIVRLTTKILSIRCSFRTYIGLPQPPTVLKWPEKISNLRVDLRRDIQDRSYPAYAAAP